LRARRSAAAAVASRVGKRDGPIHAEAQSGTAPDDHRLFHRGSRSKIGSEQGRVERLVLHQQHV
jgi:hypothetical protein